MNSNQSAKPLLGNQIMSNKVMRNQTMRQPFVVLLMGMLLAACSPAPESTAPAAPAPQDEAQATLTADEARAIAKEAYIFNYSMVMMYRTMYVQAIDTTSKSYSGGFGKWLHLGTSTGLPPLAPEATYRVVNPAHTVGNQWVNKRWAVTM
jgi:hypothetical protein